MARPRAAAAPRFTDDGLIQFGGLLGRMAAENCRRRGAASVDDTDVRGAYQDIVSPRPRPLIVDIGAEVGLWGSGAMVSYGMTLLSADAPPSGPARALLISGVLVGVFCATLKHIRLSP